MRTACTAARIVAPVARPSSTTTTVRPANDGRCTIPAQPALALDELAPGDLGAPLDLLGADAEVPDDLLVEHPQTA